MGSFTPANKQKQKEKTSAAHVAVLAFAVREGAAPALHWRRSHPHGGRGLGAGGGVVPGGHSAEVLRCQRKTTTLMGYGWFP